jgi:hypothetical protein
MPAEGLDEADEMNLYAPGPDDAPFGPADLEWLYRKHDSDGGSLDSRLARLAPVSFTNPVDGLRRRRLFSIDTWETNHFAWANDNPAVLIDHDPTDAVPRPTLRGVPRRRQSVPGPRHDGTPQPGSNTGFRADAGGTPALAHRDRRINLNYPLPISNDPDEPVRQKWIRETYQLCKAVLPPAAVDSAEELRQLSQYLVNVIDFRDPDSTLTRFENRDLVVTHPTATEAAKLRLATTAPGAPPPRIPGTPPASEYLIQHGMEYSPVAINEVLAFEFFRRGPAGREPTSRLFVELVNTLTEARLAGPGAPQASAIDLKGWDLVIMEDDLMGRPDPFTGQIPVQRTPATDVREIPLDGASVPPMTGGPDTAGDGDHHHVLGPPAAAAFARTDPDLENPPPDYHPVTGLTMTDGSGTALASDRYYWLYLRRPVNPFEVGAADYDDANPNAKRVVVDSFRFIFNKSLGKVVVDSPDPPEAGEEYLFSLQRLQPYRGGHAVPALPATTPASQVTAYGYSEQTVPAPTPPPATTEPRLPVFTANTAASRSPGRSGIRWDGATP